MERVSEFLRLDVEIEGPLMIIPDILVTSSISYKATIKYNVPITNILVRV